MRIAVYNVENLFDRAKAMNLETWEEGRPVLERFAALNSLLGQISYSPTDKKNIARLIIDLGMEKSDTGPFVLLRRNRGGLLTRPSGGGISVTADGRSDWVGSVELRDEPINEKAMRNTARVISELSADVLGFVEAESRPALTAFIREIVPTVGGEPFRHVMVIDGNDERGIDVGLACRTGFPIGRMRSHVDDRSANGQLIFSRDCPEFEVETPSGAKLLILVNHLKSKGYGGKVASDAKRKSQAERIAEIYQERTSEGYENIAVIGDFNDTPDSDALSPLLEGTSLRDISKHGDFDDGGYPGTYGLCNKGNKIDYILLSPALFESVTAGGVVRSGMWPGSRPKRWAVYDELTRPQEAGSDHAALWVDVDI